MYGDAFGTYMPLIALPDACPSNESAPRHVNVSPDARTIIITLSVMVTLGPETLPMIVAENTAVPNPVISRVVGACVPLSAEPFWVSVMVLKLSLHVPVTLAGGGAGAGAGVGGMVAVVAVGEGEVGDEPPLHAAASVAVIRTAIRSDNVIMPD